MYGKIGFKDSNVPKNGYQFHCPVVDRDALLIACWFMRGKFMKGDEFAANDCRCAMRGNKCPATHMLEAEWHGGERRFFDAEPTKHMLPTDIVQRIEQVVLVPGQAGNHPLTQEQSARLFDGKLFITRVAGDAEQVAKDQKPTKTRAVREKKLTMLSGIEQSGDMSGMLNTALGVTADSVQEN